jgi:hypothetical protein
MVIALTVYLALSLLAALVIFPALILGSRADRWMNMAVQQLSERQLSRTLGGRRVAPTRARARSSPR